MEPDDLLCSRNAWEEKGSLVVLLLAERAPSEGPRSTRAFEDRPAHPSKRKMSELWRDHLRTKYRLPIALISVGLANVALGYASRTRISLSTYRRNSSVVVKHR